MFDKVKSIIDRRVTHISTWEPVIDVAGYHAKAKIRLEKLCGLEAAVIKKEVTDPKSKRMVKIRVVQAEVTHQLQLLEIYKQALRPPEKIRGKTKILVSGNLKGVWDYAKNTALEWSSYMGTMEDYFPEIEK